MRAVFHVPAPAWLALLGAVLLPALFTGCAKRPVVPARAHPPRVLHIGNGVEPHSLDPHTAAGTAERRILIGLFEGLVTADGKTPGRVVPGVAERWEISADGLTYLFHLRADAVFSNGAPVGAGDFVAAYRRLLSPKLGAPLAYLLHPIHQAEAYHRGKLADFDAVGIRAPDPRTLQLTLDHPAPYLLALLGTNPAFAPVSLAAITAHGDADSPGNPWARAGSLVGNGPFVLDDWRPHRRIVLRKNPRYWQAAAVALDEIDFLPVEDAGTEERAFRAGMLDLTDFVPVSKIAVYKEREPAALRTDPILGVNYFLVNTTAAPLSDERVRRALAMSINREALVSQVTRAGQRVASCFTPPGTGGYTCRASVASDAAGARRLLAEAGYPGGKGLTEIELLFNTSESRRLVAEAVQEMWRHELGVTVRLRNEEWKVYLDSRARMNYQLAFGAWQGYDDPSGFLENFVTGGPNNQTGFAEPAYDQALADASREADPAARLEHFQEAEALLLGRLPVIPLYFLTHSYLIKPAVRGWFPNAADVHPWQRVEMTNDE